MRARIRPGEASTVPISGKSTCVYNTESVIGCGVHEVYEIDRALAGAGSGTCVAVAVRRCPQSIAVSQSGMRRRDRLFHNAIVS